MKAGSKMYCIKTRWDNNSEKNGNILFNIGKLYEIVLIEKNRGGKDDAIILKSNTNQGLRYRINYDKILYCIEDNFITEKEYRKQKLEKLNSL